MSLPEYSDIMGGMFIVHRKLVGLLLKIGDGIFKDLKDR